MFQEGVCFGSIQEARHKTVEHSVELPQKVPLGLNRGISTGSIR